MAKGKDKKKIDLETDTDIQKQMNTYEQYINTYVEGFLSKIFNNGIINELDMETLQKYFANPDHYKKELFNLVAYNYISNGDVFQLLELAKVLPTLNYKINVFEKSKNYEKYLGQCNKALYKVKHKTLTRDTIAQTTSIGTLCAIWLGDAKNPYLYFFDDLDYIFPAYRRNGDWVVVVDMSWLDGLNNKYRKQQLDNLYPYITQQDLDNYKNNKDNDDYKYIELPQDRSVAIRTHTLKRNQNLGINWVTPGLYEIGHKKKLKDLEKAVANKIINAIAVLTIGDEKDENYKNLKLPKGVKKKVHAGVKSALEKNSSDGITVVSIPEFAKLVFPEMKSDALEPSKFESINSDIKSSFGVSTAMVSGESGNYASAKINLDVFYKRIGVLLETIESEIYGKLFNLILPSGQKDNFQLIYDKEPPLTIKEKVDVLTKLHAEGWSLKALVDLIDGVEFSEYVEQSIYEQEEMKLQEKIKPYQTSYTSNGNDNSGGRPSDNGSGDNNNLTNNTNDIPSA